MKRQFTTAILSNKSLSDEYFELSFSWPKDLDHPEPGQFITVKTVNQDGSLLKRPFAVSNYSENTASIIIQTRGPVTRGLKTLKPGTELNITGALGNIFPDPEQNSKAILIGGGIGLGPIQYLYLDLISKGVQPLLILGYRGKDFVPDLPAEIKSQAVFCTDDGSMGYSGTTVDYLKNKVTEKDLTLYACGPKPMLKACDIYCAETQNKLWVSVEQTMACGIGACMGCVVEIMDPEKKFVRVCKEGPIFPGGFLK